MTVHRSNDIAYFRSVLARPGMARAAAGGMEPMDADAALLLPNTEFYEVRDGERRLGFVAFRRLSATVCDIHACLLTVGSRSVAAVRDAIREMAARGTERIVAVIPVANRAAEAVSRKLGFHESPTLQTHFPAEWRRHFLFRELSLCHSSPPPCRT